MVFYGLYYCSVYSVCGEGWAARMPGHLWEGQVTALWSLFYPLPLCGVQGLNSGHPAFETNSMMLTPLAGSQLLDILHMNIVQARSDLSQW